jgi:hypothetical protein
MVYSGDEVLLSVLLYARKCVIPPPPLFFLLLYVKQGERATTTKTRTEGREAPYSSQKHICALERHQLNSSRAFAVLKGEKENNTSSSSSSSHQAHQVKNSTLIKT